MIRVSVLLLEVPKGWTGALPVCRVSSLAVPGVPGNASEGPVVVTDTGESSWGAGCIRSGIKDGEADV